MIDESTIPEAQPLDGTEEVLVIQSGVVCRVNLSKFLTTTPVTITAVPTGFTATTISDTEIDLAWSGSGDYFLERSLDSSSWEPIYQGSTANYSDTLLYGDNQYFYRVAAQDTGEIISDWVFADATTDPTP